MRYQSTAVENLIIIPNFKYISIPIWYLLMTKKYKRFLLGSIAVNGLTIFNVHADPTERFQRILSRIQQY